MGDKWGYSGSTVALQWLYSGSTVALQCFKNEGMTNKGQRINEENFYD